MLYKALTVILVAILTVLWNKGPVFNKDIIKGKSVVITGASTGIGEQLAYEYAKLGANVFITARREKLLKQVIAKCKSLNPGGKFGYHAADMDNYQTESKTLIEKAVSLMQGIDTVVLNHAYFGHLTLWSGTEKELKMFEKMSGINYHSYVHIASHALPYIKSAEKGRLGVVSSTAGKLPYLLAATYCGNKFAMDGFFSTVRDELTQAKTNVTVTLAVLGSVSTAGVADFFKGEIKRMRLRTRDIISEANSPVATPTDTAKEIIEATETGVEELYFPRLFGTLYTTMPSSWTPIVRHLWPSLVNDVVYSDDFYKKQKSVILP